MLTFNATSIVRGLVAVALLLALAGAAVVAGRSHPARAHILYSTGSIVHDLYLPAGQSRCVYGPGNCATHSYSFVSANDIGGANHLCAEVYRPSDHAAVARACDWDFARTCFRYMHAPGAEHCEDEDGWSWHAGGENQGPGTTVRRHAVY